MLARTDTAKTWSCLVFDLDGTISDPGEGIYRCICHALTQHGHSLPNENTIAQYVGPPIDRTFAALTRTDDAAHIAALVAAYRARYADIGYTENQIYPGMADLLRHLSDVGIAMGVCTSKRADLAEQVLIHFQVRSCFRFVDGGDIGIAKHQQLAKLLHTGVIDSRALMIGDRAADIDAAKRNHLASAGVLWGYGDEAELNGAGANFLLAEPAHLMALIQNAASRLTSG